VNYPILPIITADNNDQIRFYKRNFRLFVPADFDYSPYFTIIKFPVWGKNKPSKHTLYHTLPWQNQETTTSHTNRPRFTQWAHKTGVLNAPTTNDIIKTNNNSPHKSDNPPTHINAEKPRPARSKA
jgi:hypothetical protein